MNSRTIILLLIFLMPTVTMAYPDGPELQGFVEELVNEHGFAEGELRDLLQQAEYQQTVIDAISRPAEKTMEWKEYQHIFLTSARVEMGAEFWERHEATLDRAERTYGVAVPVIVAIIGVETLYGKRMGTYRVLDSLSTLAFDYPARAKFFRNELKEFLLLGREEKVKVTGLVGSYAGAMGFGQFIPSSYRHYAVDFDDDGLRDIWFNPVDAIGSVANYLGRHGWQAGSPVTVTATFPAETPVAMTTSELKPVRTLTELMARGIKPNEELEPVLKAAPFSLVGERGVEYWLSLNNFYVITRYNHSKLYAMAVYQLSKAISDHRSRKTHMTEALSGADHASR